MKIKNVCLSLLVAGGLIALVPYSTHASRLQDRDGNYIHGGESTPFSMKLSCGECHEISRWTLSGGRYERPDAQGNRTFDAQKSHSGEAYAVPYPRHGVTVGFHFQQGRNVPWGDTQRDFYNLPAFTSSPGMYGKY